MIPASYAAFRDRLAKALDGDLYPIEYLDWLIVEKRAEILVTERAAIVFRIRQYPSRVLALEGLCAAGELNDIVSDLIPAAEAWGRAHGCTIAEISSRPGWQRQLKGQGYEVAQTTLRKAI